MEKKIEAEQQALLELEIMAQPDETTCGPTCLHAVYRFYNDHKNLQQVIGQVHKFEEGGTLAVWLGAHALQNGYDAHLFTANLQLFDPTWFQSKKIDLKKKLKAQLLYKKDKKLVKTSHAFLDFMKLGGKIYFKEFTRKLLRRYLTRGYPILTGLSSTYLYQSAREYGPNSEFDDIRGEPQGHFVILCGYNRETKHVLIADPFEAHPLGQSQKYEVHIDRVISAILLGILTYDANFLIIRPKSHYIKKAKIAI